MYPHISYNSISPRTRSLRECPVAEASIHMPYEDCDIMGGGPIHEREDVSVRGDISAKTPGGEGVSPLLPPA